MSRSLSLNARRAIFAQETGEVFLILVTIDHASLADPIRVVNNTQDIIKSVGGAPKTFVAFPFQIELPGEDDEQITSVRLQIDNVDQRIVEAVRLLDSPPTITVEVVLASDPDTVEAGPFEFSLRNVEYDTLVVQGELRYEDILNAPYPAHSFDTTYFPGVH